MKWTSIAINDLILYWELLFLNYEIYSINFNIFTENKCSKKESLLINTMIVWCSRSIEYSILLYFWELNLKNTQDKSYLGKVCIISHLHFRFMLNKEACYLTFDNIFQLLTYIHQARRDPLGIDGDLHPLRSWHTYFTFSTRTRDSSYTPVCSWYFTHDLLLGRSPVEMYMPRSTFPHV